MRIENARRAFDNQAMQIIGPDRFAERFTQSVQKIENQSLFDLDLFLRAFQLPDPTAQLQPGENPAGQKCEQQSVEKIWPHERPASLLRRCLVMKVLF